MGEMDSASRAISTAGRSAKSLSSVTAMIGMITNIATSERPRSDGRRTTSSTSPGVVWRPNPKTIITTLACTASRIDCCRVMVALSFQVAIVLPPPLRRLGLPCSASETRAGPAARGSEGPAQ